jgi:hypothetical protein
MSFIMSTLTKLYDPHISHNFLPQLLKHKNIYYNVITWTIKPFQWANVVYPFFEHTWASKANELLFKNVAN